VRLSEPVPAGAGWLRPMTVADLDVVLALEQRSHSFAWTRGNLLDSLAAGHLAWVLEAPEPPAPAPLRCLGYYIAMLGVEEMHLLNITVAPECQGQGFAQRMLAHLAGLCRAALASTLWLEVRQSNAKALRLYERWGFEAVGLRKGYYPAAHGQREHALVMRWPVPLGAPHAVD
jgi:ribosomal-protein-alanine N-acetyltransferase